MDNNCRIENSYIKQQRKEQQETSTRRFELPMKRDDHTPEALGRMLAGKYHSAATQYGGSTRISHAKFLNGMGSKFNSREPMGVATGRGSSRRSATWTGA